MGSSRVFLIMILLAVSSQSLLSVVVHASDSHDPNSLDSFLHFLANQTSLKHPTGTPYRVPLPSNFSGMEVSAIRLRTSSFWRQGANLSSIRVPPNVLPWPFVSRIVMIFENMGNWSDDYYQVPGYSRAAPIVGFNFYDATNLSALGDQKLGISIMGDLISVRFPDIVKNENQNMTFQCVRFGEGGLVEFKNITETNVCMTKEPGQFSVVVPSSPSEPPAETKKKKKKERGWIGIVGGLVGVAALLILAGVLVFRFAGTSRIKKMEKQSDKDVAFETFWVGQNRMPTASMTRTLPVLEHNDVP